MFVDRLLSRHIHTAQKFQSLVHRLPSEHASRLLLRFGQRPVSLFQKSNAGYMIACTLDTLRSADSALEKHPYLLFFYKDYHRQTQAVAYKITADFIASECVLLAQYCQTLLYQRNLVPVDPAEMMGFRFYQYADRILQECDMGQGITFLDLTLYQGLEFANHVLQLN